MENNGFTNKEILVSLAKKVDDGFNELKGLINAGHLDHEARLRLLEADNNSRKGENALKRWAAPLMVALVGALWWLPSYIH